MDTIETIYSRSSVRSFSSRKPDESLVADLVEAAIRAPSAGNIQPWRFFAVWNPEVKRCLARASLSQKHVENAPVVIVVCVDLRAAESGYGHRGRSLYCLQDAAAATENLLLAARASGLGSCWVGAFDEEGAGSCIGLEPDLRPVTLVPLGYASADTGPRTRKPLDEVLTTIR